MPDLSKVPAKKLKLEDLIHSLNAALFAAQDLDGEVFFIEDYGSTSINLYYGDYDEEETFQEGAQVREFGFDNKNDVKDWLASEYALLEINLVTTWYLERISRKAEASKRKSMDILK
ncbi:hypothetical protein LVQ79_17170 [Buttiauxella sp. A2-C1_F]|uniref:hypothetical protein n=1 Tax=unclassified Buttiauxella TaxID=2634062 RepID=UPI001E450363|nr:MULTISPECIES: hypothetical protein [unclassified Buttiauxella]MCE0812193.1 hypothetical protein [Buttiauxella sp. S04-F03]MCE0847270.1 hypothetical protein [Buttiauxella sp. A2-C1_F]